MALTPLLETTREVIEEVMGIPIPEEARDNDRLFRCFIQGALDGALRDQTISGADHAEFTQCIGLGGHPLGQAIHGRLIQTRGQHQEPHTP